jgi:hypothetical protein
MGVQIKYQRLCNDCAITMPRVDPTRLEMARGVKGWSEEQLAEKAGISRNTVRASYEVGCSTKKVKAMAKVLLAKTQPWYWLLEEGDRKAAELLEPPEGSSMLPLLMSHRNDPVGHRYFEEALKSCRRVIFIATMSKSSFDAIDQYLSGDTQLHVLTWMPVNGHEIMGYAKHLGETGDKIAQVKNALREWDKRIDPDKKETYRPNITVKTYASSPTLQGVLVEKKWAMIELLPYEAGTVSRPGLLLREEEDAEKEAFEFFWKRFDSMWDKARARGNDMGSIPDWHRDLKSSA